VTVSAVYISTRGGIAPVPFGKAVLMGLATDGGLLLPQELPDLGGDLDALRAMSYPELAVAVMRPFAGDDVPESDLTELVDQSCRAFSHPDILPIRQLGFLHLMELFHGPTLAFKDVALQFLGNLFEYLLRRTGRTLNILAATSGDTGSAAIYGVRGKENMHIFVMHPHGRVSPTQERQMTTVLDKNVHNIAIDGTFDDGLPVLQVD